MLYVGTRAKSKPTYKIEQILFFAAFVALPRCLLHTVLKRMPFEIRLPLSGKLAQLN